MACEPELTVRDGDLLFIVDAGHEMHFTVGEDTRTLRDLATGASVEGLRQDLQGKLDAMQETLTALQSAPAGPEVPVLSQDAIRRRCSRNACAPRSSLVTRLLPLLALSHPLLMLLLRVAFGRSPRTR